jgi:hypothetical protein
VRISRPFAGVNHPQLREGSAANPTSATPEMTVMSTTNHNVRPALTLVIGVTASAPHVGRRVAEAVGFVAIWSAAGDLLHLPKHRRLLLSIPLKCRDASPDLPDWQ